MRVVAVLNIFILSGLALVVAIRAGLLLPEWMSFSRGAIWVVIAYCVVGGILNTITPSRIERIWAPLVWILLAASIVVGRG